MSLCKPFKYIPNWQTLDLKCTVCGTTKSVKYGMADGKVRCNLCVGKMNAESARAATIAVAGVIAAAYHVTGRTPYDARSAIIKWISEPHIPGTRLLTVGDLFRLTDWESNAPDQVRVLPSPEAGCSGKSFYRKDGCSGGQWECEHCGVAWLDHICPGSQCPNKEVDRDK
jgi:ribosomal protein S27E